MPLWIYLLIGILLGALAATLGVSLYYKKGLSKESKELERRSNDLAEEKSQVLARSEKLRQEEEKLQVKTEESKAKADEIIAEAEKRGEERRNEFLEQCRNEINKAKEEFEKSVKQKRNELQSEKYRLDKKEAALDQKHLNFDQKLDALKEEGKLLEEKKEELDKREAAILNSEAEKIAELEKIASLTRTEAKELILAEANDECIKDKAILIRDMIKRAEETAEQEAKQIVVSVIQRYASDYVSDNTVYVVNLPADDMKGRIIGREGRNIRSFEKITGVQVLLDDTPQAVILSCFNPIAREIARIVLDKLIFDGRIHPTSIEETYKKVCADFDKKLKEIGENAAMELNLPGFPPEVIKMLGRLNFRTSYGQNVLQHSMEVARFAGMLAKNLGLDQDLAMRAGLLHDIGKASDFEENTTGTHVTIGAELARKYKMHDVIVNSIESHHGDVEAKYLISSLVAAADAISASRPGARQGEDVEKYIQRIEKMEEIASKTAGVDRAYALQAGREIRVIVCPEEIDDDQMPLIGRSIAKNIEKNCTYPGQIKVQVIRERRCTDIAE